MNIQAVECWRVNLHRAVGAMGGPSSLGGPVWKAWATDQTIYHAKPVENGKYQSGSRRDCEPLYPTEREAWTELLAMFDEWASEKRAAIVKKIEEASKR